MIIGAGFPHRLADFLAGLEHAGRGVLRVQSLIGSSLCTGWLITDQLMVLPGFAVDRARPSTDRYLCWPAEGDSVEAELVHLPATDADVLRPALLRLAEPRPGGALDLHVAATGSDAQILLLHYPEGVPDIRLSLGRVLAVPGDRIHHDAQTSPGSAGAPVLDAGTRAAVGMHTGRSDPTASAAYTEAISLTAMLDELRSTPFWPEIANHHRLADFGAASPVPPPPGGPGAAEPGNADPDPGLLAAALRWSVDPTSLDDSTRERLRPLVGNDDEPRWSMIGDERRRLITAAGSLDAARSARAAEPAPTVASTDADPGQRTIDRILDGPPFDLAEVSDDDLPYWLQATVWFAAVAQERPSPARCHRELARRRIRNRLTVVAGERLWGREDALADMATWFADPRTGPMVVTGIGGVGKSALVARFALERPPGTLLLWLDFDRPDLAPDDGESVLRALVEQASVQLDGVAPATNRATGMADASETGAALAAALPAGAPPPLLVLDGFEIAQHVERHEEIWEVLGRVLAGMPATRVVVSGRAPVPGLVLGDRQASSLHLVGLPTAAARAWLADRGVTDPDQLAAVLDIADGVPLLLKLAVRLIASGGADSLVTELPRALIDGYLYQRIIERVVDQPLRRLAHDVLQLRTISAEMISDVLGDRFPDGAAPEAVFATLTRQIALVENLDSRPGPAPAGAEPLRLRPEVRTATLRLLEYEDPGRVREIDRRAIAWYATQNSADAAIAAELVYHHLRLGDVIAAESLWREALAPLLAPAVDEIPEAFPAARQWLRERTSGAIDRPSGRLDAWETTAAERIRASLGRGLVRVMPQILAERADRSPASPLTVYDAWARWQFDGDLAGARQILDAAAWPSRQRDLLGACLAAEAGDRVAADALLAPLDDPAAWADRRQGISEAVAVRAARVRLTIDLEAELELAGLRTTIYGDDLGTALRDILTPSDVVLPSLSRSLGPQQESMKLALKVPTATAPGDFARLLDEERLRDATRYPPALRLGPPGEPLGGDAWTAAELGLTPADLWSGPRPERVEAGLSLGLRLAALARRRWRIAAHTTFLADAAALIQPSDFVDTLEFAVLGTVAAVRGQQLTFEVGSIEVNADYLVWYASQQRVPTVGPNAGAAVAPVAAEAVRHEWRLLGPPGESLQLIENAAPSAWRTLPIDGWDTGLNTVIVLLLGPNPLDALVRRVLGFPDIAAGELR